MPKLKEKRAAGHQWSGRVGAEVVAPTMSGLDISLSNIVLALMGSATLAVVLLLVLLRRPELVSAFIVMGKV